MTVTTLKKGCYHALMLQKSRKMVAKKILLPVVTTVTIFPSPCVSSD